MSILRIATAEADFTTMGGAATTNATYFDSDRVENAFALEQSETASLVNPEAAGTETWYHFVYSQSGASFNGDPTIATFTDSQNTTLSSIRMDGNRMYFRIVGDNTFEGNFTVIAIQTPTVIDVQIIVNNNVDITVNAYVNSALQFSSTQANSANKGKPISCLFNNNDNGFTIFVSEMIIADEDTRGFRLREFKPQSFGVFQQWDGTVSSIVDPSLATGISTDVADERVSFGVSNLENVQGGDIVNRVVAQSYAQRGTSGLTALNHFFRYDDGNIQDGPDITLGLFGDWYLDEYPNNPRTAAPWVPSDLAGLQLGVRART